MSAENTSPKLPRRFKWLLGVSLTLNVAVLGLIGGAMLHGPKNQGPMDARASFALVAALEREDRRAVLKGMRARGAEQRRAQRASLEVLLEQLRVEAFSKQEVQALLENTAANRQAIQDGILERWLTRVEAMSPEARRAYADRLESKLKRRKSPEKGR